MRPEGMTRAACVRDRHCRRQESTRKSETLQRRMVLAVVRLQPSEEQTMKSCTLQTSGINFKPSMLQILNEPRARLTPLEKFAAEWARRAFAPHPLRRGAGTAFKSAGMNSTLNHSVLRKNAAPAPESISRKAEGSKGRRCRPEAARAGPASGCKVTRRVAGG